MYTNYHLEETTTSKEIAKLTITKEQYLNMSDKMLEDKISLFLVLIGFKSRIKVIHGDIVIRNRDVNELIYTDFHSEYLDICCLRKIKDYAVVKEIYNEDKCSCDNLADIFQETINEIKAEQKQ